MQILGIKEYGIKKYQTGTQKGGIQPQSEEERYNQYLEQMKKQYPGTYIDQTPIWPSINFSKEIKSYGEFLEELKTSNPEEYNRIMESSAQSETSEISKPWIDSEGNVRRSINVGAGFVSGTDPIMRTYVEGVALNPVFKAIGTAGLYGLGKLGNNWARAKLISNTMNQSLRTPQVIMPNNVGWGPKQRIPITHSSTTGEMELFYPKRWDVVQEGANPHGIWLQGKLGIPRTEITNPGKGMKAQKARQLFADRLYQLKGEVELDKPIVTVGEVPNRSQLSYYADNSGADGLIYNGVYDNGYNANQVILSYKLPSIPNSKRVKIPGKSYQASIGNPVQIKDGVEYYMPNQLIEEVKRGKEAAAKFFEHPVVQQSYKHNQELAEKLGITIPDRPENIGNIIRQPVKIRWSGAPSNSHAAVAQTHLGDPDAVISYQWMPFDRKSFGITTIHENLHRGFYSAPLKFPNISKEYYDNIYKPQYSFYNWKTKKLLKPEYYDSYLADISGGEAGPNFIDLGRDLGLKLGQKYPGYEEANNILQNYTGFKSWMIPQLNTSKAGIRHIWDAMTGKYFTIPVGGALINQTIQYNDRN